MWLEALITYLHLEIVFATGDLQSDTLVMLLDVGCRTFIKKGIGADEIRQKIMESVSRFRRERMLLKPIALDDRDQISKDLWSIGIVGQTQSMHDTGIQRTDFLLFSPLYAPRF